ncbi:surface antigen family protein [Ehrlichia chaffeensis str. Heartland]|uniref:P44/Msp2 family outer membrane protein n=1 Tax=Ehrlichia chaffeensis TaxID=945 RepID=UPI000444DE99|nr:P44/Msp2 family outer membrane protein [Ehrlichia chaffeensis]AHX03238.1 surface antigen family protein [Ehrlichia chaffeensis str. Heartland]AHX08538.1 surface antigen family protein [Ehrlichia chaffeensis str. Saint Vincent]AHX09721.1 surface antigen family protein [Ehrlichia chaffeensis str. Wakulla]AHX10965.1 surface antigen family protein [Ehrlichia chaffeensis str. West Paces]
MSYAKVFILICLILLVPSLSFAIVSNDFLKDNIGHFYIGGQYKPGIPRFNRFLVTNNNIREIISLQEDCRNTIPHMVQSTAQGILPSKVLEEFRQLLHDGDFFTLPYNPTYKKNLLGGGGVVGYSITHFRVELEAFYEKFNLTAPAGYLHKNFYEYFALATEMDPTRPNQPAEGKYYCMKNTGITLSPFIINACYDFILKKAHNIAPYLCLGVGGNFIDFLDQVSFKLTYQAKVGISYFISPNIAFFIDGSFHGHLNNQFSDLPVDYSSSTKFTTISAKFNVNFLTSSIGIRFISK